MKHILTHRAEAGASQLLAAFKTAKNKGLLYPKMRLGSFTFKSAPDTGKNAGSLYLTSGETYLGKLGPNAKELILMYDDKLAELIAILEDVPGAATAYGQRTGQCCICGRLLTAKESVAHSIGPICAEKFGIYFASNDDVEIPDDF